MTTMKRFRDDNTDGFDAADLAVLNAEYEAVVNPVEALCDDIDSIERRSWCDYIAEGVLRGYGA